MPPHTLALSTAQVPFEWSAVAAADRDWLRARTQDIVGLAYRSACDAVRIGTALADARRRLPHGQYESWVERELPFSLAAARRFRQVGAAFAAFQIAQFERFDESALYLLAQEKTPRAARDYAAELAGGGERITRAVALEILAAHKPCAEPTRCEVKAYEAGVKGVRGPETSPKEQEGAEKVSERHRRLGAALELLLSGCRILHISQIEDEDFPEPVYSLSCFRADLPAGAADTRPRNVVRRNLLHALDCANGREQEKRCPGCKKTKPVGEFGCVATALDSMNRYCKVCERKRVKRAKTKARQTRADRGATGQKAA